MAEEVVVPKEEEVVVPPQGDPKEDVVPKKAYEEVAADLQKKKARERDLEKQLKEAKDREKELNLKALREKEDYKTMYETLKTEKDQTDQELSTTRQTITISSKWNAVSRELLGLGINSSTLRDVEKLVDFDEIEVEFTSLGRVNVLNAKDYAEKFKARSPYYFTNTTRPNVNTNTPTVISSSTITMDIVKAAEKEYYKTRSPEAERKYKEALMAMKAKQ